MPPGDINVLAFVKGNERYIFIYEDDQSDEVLRRISSMRRNVALSLTWYDAIVLSQKVRRIAAKKRKNDEKQPSRFQLPHSS